MDRFNQSTNWRVLRGGSWATARPEEMLLSYRRGYDPLFRMDDVDFGSLLRKEASDETAKIQPDLHSAAYAVPRRCWLYRKELLWKMRASR
jgi:hypothetical protein